MSESHYLRDELYALVRSSDDIFEFLQSGSLDGIWYWDLEHQEHEWISPAVWRLLGYDPATKQHLASEWQDLIFLDDLKVALGNLQRHLADPSHPYDQIVRYRHRDGSTVWVRCRGIAIRNEDGRPIRMLGAHTDVTAAMKAEQEASNLAAELKRSNEALQTFGHSVAHDLRAPLQAALWHLEELGERAVLGAEERRLLGDAQRNLSLMADIVRVTMTLSRVTKSTPDTKAVPMTELARSVANDLQDAHPDRRIDIDIGILPEVVGDEAMLRMVWTNLLTNAVKYTATRDEAQIQVSGRVTNQGAEFSVSDNGVGFSEHFLRRIFVPFNRAPTAASFEGLGVGLSMVKAIVERHGGTVSAEGKVDEGATIAFTIPRSEAA